MVLYSAKRLEHEQAYDFYSSTALTLLTRKAVFCILYCLFKLGNVLTVFE